MRFTRWPSGSACLILLTLAAGCAAGPSGRAKGVREAMAAVAAGTLTLKEYPALPSSAEHGEYVKLLRERCGVGYEVPSLPPGVSEEDFREEVRGWNDTIEAEIGRKFGPDTIARLRQEAREQWEARVKAKGKE